MALKKRKTEFDENTSVSNCEINGPNLSTLPTETLLHIGRYLSARDLLAMSGSCHHLRAAYNDNMLWRRYTQKLGNTDTNVGKRLTGTESVLDPGWDRPVSNSLQPLCEERISFINQSRLIKSLREHKYLKYSLVPQNNFSQFTTPLGAFYTADIHTRITYNCKYLFQLGSNVQDLVCRVYNIQSAPSLLTTIKLENHFPFNEDANDNFEGKVYLQVVDNVLVVRQDHFIDVYQISLPSLDFPLLHSIQISDPSNVKIFDVVLHNILFVEKLSKKVIQAWNVKTGEQLDDISVKGPGVNSDLKILAYSKNSRYLLLCSECSDEEGTVCCRLFAYNIESLNYTQFSVALTKGKTEAEHLGLINENYIVLLSIKEQDLCEVSVFDLSTSLKVAQKNFPKLTHVKYGCTIADDNLILENLVLNILTLDVLWTLDYFPIFRRLQLIDINQCRLLVVPTSGEQEVWDLTRRKRLFDLPGHCSVSTFPI